jgi:integrase/recombinase XerC
MKKIHDHSEQSIVEKTVSPPALPPGSFSVQDCIEKYLENIGLARSQRTALTYRNAMNSLRGALQEHKLVIEKTSITAINEEIVGWLAVYLKNLSPATESLYLTATAGFLEYLVAERLADVNLPRMRLLIRQRSRRPGQRLPQFPRDAIDQILDKVNSIAERQGEDEHERLRDLRDRAFLLTLADTGLRVHEACALRRGDIDWNEGRAIMIGKGNREAVIRFSSRSLAAVKSYLSARAQLDGASGKPLTSLPIFTRHDRGSGHKATAITTATGRNIVADRVQQILGKEAVGTITPHSFRHYFVTRVLQASGNLKLAQELARHKNIAVTQRYAHLTNDELDKGYWDAIEPVKD